MRKKCVLVIIFEHLSVVRPEVLSAMGNDPNKDYGFSNPGKSFNAFRSNSAASEDASRGWIKQSELHHC